MKYATLVVSLALVLSACGGSKVVREPPAPLPDFTPQTQIHELWSAGVGGVSGKLPVRLVPHLDGNTIYATDMRGRVTALAADSGRRLWETNINLTVTGATGVGEGLVVVGGQKGQVIALNREDGKQAWSATVSSSVMSPPVAHAGVVVVQTVDGKLTGLTVADGKRLWVYERSEPALSLIGTAAPIVVDDFVLSGFASGKIVALNIKDGRALWEFTVSQPRGRNEVERMVDVDAPPLIVRDTLYAASYQGKIVAVDMRASGRLLWTRDASTFSGMDAGRGNIYLSDEKGHVLALDQTTGASVWKQDKLRGRGLSAPAYINGYVVVGDYQGYLHWLSAEDGRFVARHRVGSDAVTARAIPGVQALYVLNQGGSLAALQPRAR
ncbi:MAG: outer membrane protein assembly factor BamB [Gammaproteobacteria bacterium]|nr:outer membrane protein assembly factor BamB [Gammaproteobacteria bacterium]